ncbi:hypothetical protein OG21DRAFT_1386806, partial [Imleria badia]
LKTAARLRFMTSDPVGNLCYCYTPLAAYVADTPEQTLVACVGSKTSPFTTATSKQFGGPVRHNSRTRSHTLLAICKAMHQCSPKDFEKFVKYAKALLLNGVVKPFWFQWLLSCPSIFLHVEPLHHIHCFTWGHNVKWWIAVITESKIDFRF